MFKLSFFRDQKSWSLNSSNTTSRNSPWETHTRVVSRVGKTSKRSGPTASMRSRLLLSAEERPPAAEPLDDFACRSTAVVSTADEQNVYGTIAASSLSGTIVILVRAAGISSSGITSLWWVRSAACVRQCDRQCFSTFQSGGKSQSAAGIALCISTC